MIPVLSLMAGCRNLLSKLINDESDFGVMDLMKPCPKRTLSFVSTFKNFWLFCSQQQPAVNAVQEGVDNLANKRIKLEDDIEVYRTKINRCRSKVAEDRQEEDALEREIAQ